MYVSEIVLVVLFYNRNAFIHACGETPQLFYPKTKIKIKALVFITA